LPARLYARGEYGFSVHQRGEQRANSENPDRAQRWNYSCDEATLAELQENRQILFRYTSPDGKDDHAGNPNGSVAHIAGICNRERNVAGLMPHPERAVESALDSEDGLVVFRSMMEALVGAAKATA
jgi:Phosphoribosylformylglycinamidine (FGAM) synthase, glutamine amidotransferase domain